MKIKIKIRTTNLQIILSTNLRVSSCTPVVLIQDTTIPTFKTGSSSRKINRWNGTSLTTRTSLGSTPKISLPRLLEERKDGNITRVQKRKSETRTYFSMTESKFSIRKTNNQRKTKRTNRKNKKTIRKMQRQTRLSIPLRFRNRNQKILTRWNLKRLKPKKSTSKNSLKICYRKTINSSSRGLFLAQSIPSS